MKLVKNSTVRCNECIYARGYWPMYVGNDARKWGTSTCVRLKRHKRVDTLCGFDGCNKGIKKQFKKGTNDNARN